MMVRESFIWMLFSVSMMGASYASETIPSADWGPTWKVPIQYRTITSPPIIKLVPPDPARVRTMLKELLALCDQLSQAAGEREECRELAIKEAELMR